MYARGWRCAWGLKNMQRRARQVNGELHIDSRSDAGAMIELAVPIRQQTAPVEGQAVRGKLQQEAAIDG